MDLLYYIVGEFMVWTAILASFIGFGYWLSESVHEMGGWKPWADDFFGLTYNEKEDHK
ncbi:MULTISPECIES: hypothetical protein [Levilactobacillus]|uniref:Uncharacterized protein n=1 Tax=Levilactobacillus namurensis TaxID=380393 RepID=A0AAW8WAI4_9LACO|nr:MULTISPECIES: hypothetical protein [Levilactobacillus]MDT7015388.1 hypothetical protein [Levilactobacillus namurensis]QMU08613.1 hypothetical protein H3M12_02790 [Levilactobacillus suantsaii]